MASNREERFLQRQRGAGIHKIQDIDFDLAFPGGNNVPLRPQRSSRRRTPQQDQQPLVPQRSSRRTPNSSQAFAPGSSTRRTPTTAWNHLPERPSSYDIPRTEDKERLSSSQATRSDSQGSVSKKRKITGPASARRLSTIAQTALLETPVTRSSEPKSALKSNESTDGPIGHGVETLGDLAVVIPDSGHDQNQGNSVSIAKSRAKRRSNGTSLVSPDTQSEEQEQGSTSEQQQLIRTTRRRNQKASEAVLELRKPSQLVMEEAEDQEGPEEEASEDEMQAPGRPLTVQTRPRKPLATVEEEDWEEEEEEPQPGGENEKGSKVAKVATKPPKQHSRPSRPRAIPPIISKRSSAKVKKPGRKQQPLSASGEGVTEPDQDTSGPRTGKESVPITVHRLSRLQALQYGDDEQSILYGPPPFPKRNGVNAVDVLGQACREIITKIVEKVDAAAESGRSETTKGEWKTKKKAAATFGTELESRLFDMSEGLDNNWALSVRLRQANKEKAALRQELLRIRREREKVALRTDEVRRLHEEATKSSQARNKLNTALHDIELAVERGRTQQQSQTDINSGDTAIGGGLALRLHTVAAKASLSSSGGGLLNQVKEFNAFLEKTATLLEGRAA